MAWRFTEKQKRVVSRDPVEAEFFTPDGYSDALVREVIQNSLDAGAGSQVRVRFHFSGPGEDLALDRTTHYLAGLREHLEAAGNKVVGTIERMPFLVVEDFGTRGLAGDPAQHQDHAPGTNEPDNFYRFWRNIGRSAKSGKDRGRWGLGKTVYPATSQLNTFFGLTVRADGSALLMGQSITRVHELNGQQFFPEGFFARFDAEGFQLPFDDPETIDQFRHDFALERTASAPGLSVVVPLPAQIDAPVQTLRQSIIAHYFHAILRGELVVQVSGPDHVPITIDKLSIDEHTDHCKWKSGPRDSSPPRPPIDLARWATSVEEKAFVKLALAGATNAPAWSEDLFPQASLPQLRDRLDAGERLAIRARLCLERLGGTKEETYYDVFIERDPQVARGEDHYVRAGMAIHRVARDKLPPQFRALVVITDRVLSSFLGDTEGPAHAEWSENETRPDETYSKWVSRLRFIKKSASTIAEYLQKPPEGLDVDLLKHIFSFDAPVAKKGGGRRKKGTTVPPPVPPARAQPFAVRRTAGGFSIVPSGQEPAPPRIRVQLAYDTPSGNPFRTYEVFDFDLAGAGGPPVEIESRGATILSRAENVLEVEINSPDFEVRLTGFDEKRDLCVRARAVEVQA